jgi:4-amino-4-deoxy-L-arabinose transferase-like glycosyltransferase
MVAAGYIEMMKSGQTALPAYLNAPPLVMLLGLYMFVWMAAQLVSHTNFDPYGDMLENFIWGQSFAWGNPKHPPLLGWITGSWFTVMPHTQANYYLLAYGNAAIGLAGIFYLGQILKLNSIARPAALLMILALPYSTLAMKFNANTILLALWPWIAVAWIMGLDANHARRKRWLSGIALGTLAALGMLAKYYTGVFLLSLALITLLTPQGRAYLKTFTPWLALMVFVLVLGPHLWWLSNNHFASLNYVAAQGDGEVNLTQLGKFAVTPLGYWLLPFLAVVLLTPGRSLARLWQCWQPRDRSDLLFWLAITPYLLTLLFGLSGFVSLSSPWAIPLGFPLTLLWLRNLSLEQDVTGNDSLVNRSQNIFLGFLIAVLLLSPAYAWYKGSRGNPNYYLPTIEAVQQTEQLFPDYSWVSGDYADAAAVAFYGTKQARYVANISNRPTSNGLIFCHLGLVSEARGSNLCTQRAEQWARQRKDNMMTAEFTAVKAGPRFPKHRPHLYRVYFYQH